MKEEFTISVLESDLNKLLSSKITAKKFIDILFLDEENNEVLQTSCLYYYKFKGDSPDITDFKIDLITFERQSLKGSLLCDFKMENNVTFTEKITWDFEIDSDELLVQFTGEDVPSRMLMHNKN